MRHIAIAGGGLSAAQLDRLAAATFRRAGGREHNGALVPMIIRLWKDAKAVQVVPETALRSTPAALARIDGRLRIFVWETVTPDEFRFSVAHELAHAVFLHERMTFSSPDDEECAADSLALRFDHFKREWMRTTLRRAQAVNDSLAARLAAKENRDAA